MTYWYNDDYSADDTTHYDDGFQDYVPTALVPGRWFLGASIGTAILVMTCLLPCLVYRNKRKKKSKKIYQTALALVSPKRTTPEAPIIATLPNNNNDEYQIMPEEMMMTPPPTPPSKQFKKLETSLHTITRFDLETKRLLRYALPFTLAEAATAVLGSAGLALVGHYCGTPQLAAVAIMEIIVGLLQGVVDGPLEALTVLCSHAIGASNEFLAGQYVQLGLLMYGMLQAPLAIVLFGWTDRIILFLQWGDEDVANYAQAYIRIYIWSSMCDCIYGGVLELYQVAGHELYATAISILHELVVVVVFYSLILMGVPVDVEHYAWVCLASSILFLCLTVGLAKRYGWLQPYEKGMYRNFAFKNETAVANMLKTFPALSLGSVLGNAEWAILTVFASYMGEAEVAAWAILGSIWEVFETSTGGIGEAAEIRVAYNLGNYHPYKAKLSAYKALYIGTILSVVGSSIFFALVKFIPAFFTVDETLQGMIGECLPLVGIGNLVMSFGMLCWYMIGAQGRYKLATWIMAFTSYGITIPLAAVSVYRLQFNLQSLVASVVLGYVGVGATLAYILLTSDWVARAEKILKCNSEEEDTQEDEDEEAMYAALQATRSRLARAVCTGNIKLLSAPPGPVGISVGTRPHRKGPIVTNVFLTSPFRGKLFEGDSLLSVDGVSVLSFSIEQINEILHQNEHLDRQLTIMMATPNHYRETDTSEVLLTGTVPDITDFEETETLLPSWWDGPPDEEGPWSSGFDCSAPGDALCGPGFVYPENVADDTMIPPASPSPIPPPAAPPINAMAAPPYEPPATPFVAPPAGAPTVAPVAPPIIPSVPTVVAPKDDDDDDANGDGGGPTFA